MTFNLQVKQLLYRCGEGGGHLRGPLQLQLAQQAAPLGDPKLAAEGEAGFHFEGAAGDGVQLCGGAQHAQEALHPADCKHQGLYLIHISEPTRR